MPRPRFLRSTLGDFDSERKTRKKTRRLFASSVFHFVFLSFLPRSEKNHAMLSSTLRREASKLVRGLCTSALARGGAHVSLEKEERALARSEEGRSAFFFFLVFLLFMLSIRSEARRATPRMLSFQGGKRSHMVCFPAWSNRRE